MGDKTKALRKEKDDLKNKLNYMKKEFHSLKSKMAEQQFLSDSHDDALEKSESSLLKALDNFSGRLDLIYKQLKSTESTKPWTKNMFSRRRRRKLFNPGLVNELIRIE